MDLSGRRPRRLQVSRSRDRVRRHSILRRRTRPVSGCISRIAPPEPKSSGYRIAAGVAAIALAFVELVYSGLGLATASTMWALSLPLGSVGSMFTIAAVVGIVLGLGTLAVGIVLLAQHRRRNRGTPIILFAFGSLGILAAAVDQVNNFGIWSLEMALPLALPLIILVGIGTANEKRGV